MNLRLMQTFICDVAEDESLSSDELQVGCHGNGQGCFVGGSWKKNRIYEKQI